jgi:hypothetical protein
VEEVLEGLGAASRRTEISLDLPAGGDAGECLPDLLVTPGPSEEPEGT